MSIQDMEYVSAQMLKGTGVSYNLALRTSYIGCVLQALASGAALVVSYSYFYRFRHDFWAWRALVGVMTLFTSILVIITCIDMKWWLEGPTFAHFVLKENSITLANFLLVGSNAFLTQSFFSYRAFVLSQRKWTVLIVCSSLSIAAYGSALALAATGWTHPIVDETTSREHFDAVIAGQMHSLGDKMKLLAQIWCTLSLVADLSITLIIIFILYRTRSGFKQTDTIIHKVVVTISEAMIAPLCCATIFAVLLWRGEHLLGWIRPFGDCQGAFYHLAVATSLISRDHIRSVFVGTAAHVWASSQGNHGRGQDQSLSGGDTKALGGSRRSRYGDRKGSQVVDVAGLAIELGSVKLPSTDQDEDEEDYKPPSNYSTQSLGLLVQKQGGVMVTIDREVRRE